MQSDDAKGAAPASSAAALPAHNSAALGANAPATAATADAIVPPAVPATSQLSGATPAISAANLTATPAASAAIPLSGLAVEIAASARAGKTRFEVRLDPADLGRIDVRIDVDRSGQVTSHLTVEKAETLSMLQQDSSQLRQALNDAGLKTGGGGLQFSLRDQTSSNQHNNQSNGNAQRLVISEDETVPAAVAGRKPGIVERALQLVGVLAQHRQRLGALDRQMRRHLAVAIDVDADIDAAEVGRIEPYFEAALAALGGSRDFHRKPAQRYGSLRRRCGHVQLGCGDRCGRR